MLYLKKIYYIKNKNDVANFLDCLCFLPFWQKICKKIIFIFNEIIEQKLALVKNKNASSAKLAFLLFAIANIFLSKNI